MPLRLLELSLAPEHADAAPGFVGWLRDGPAIDAWVAARSDDRVALKAVLEARDVEQVADETVRRFGAVARLVLLPVEATQPLPEADSPEPEEPDEDAAPDRVSREELYADLEESVTTSRLFVLQVVLSTLVAAVGLLRDDVAVIIGAMVIAPLLGPNVALAFGATLGDLRFVRRALYANLTGLGIAALLAFLAGTFFDIDAGVAAIAGRTSPGIDDVVLALAAGVAGTLAFTSGLGTSVIGVMVAVALLPPLVVAAMLGGAGLWQPARGALMLLSVNVISVNLAAVATFLSLGIRPRAWWQQQGARRSSRLALLVWAGLLITLLAVLLLEAR